VAQVHRYEVDVRWTGDEGTGTSSYRAYRRDHDVASTGKPTIAGSSDPAFRGDAARWNPEELLVAAVSQCHMLWYLHLSIGAGIVVVGYEDHATATMTEHADGSGEIVEVTLHPRVTVADASTLDAANALHAEVHRFCFIARSVHFPVHHEPVAHARSAAGAPEG